VLLDKTDTLTYGKPRVAFVDPLDGLESDELLQIAATAERNSEHPLALVVVAAAKERQLVIGDPSSFTYTPG
jgi:cation transport ATPase